MMQHMSAPVPDLREVWPECPHALAAAVAKAMQKSPGARHQSYAEFSADLRSAYDSFTAHEFHAPPIEPYRGTEPYVFISYSHRDTAIVFPELRRLRDLGVRAWYDEGIEPGSDEWTEVIAAALKGAVAMLYYVTPRSVASKHCRREFQYADTHGKAIFPVFLEHTDLPPGLDLQMSSRQAILRYELSPERRRVRAKGTCARNNPPPWRRRHRPMRMRSLKTSPPRSRPQSTRPSRKQPLSPPRRGHANANQNPRRCSGPP